MEDVGAPACQGRRISGKGLAANPELGYKCTSWDAGGAGPARGWTWEGEWARGHFGREARSRCSCGTVGTWENASVCAPVQLGVSVTLNLRDPLPAPGDLLFSLSRGTPAARWGRPRSVGRLGDNPIPSRGFLTAEGHLALSGYAMHLQNGGQREPRAVRGWRRAGSERLGRALAALYGLDPIYQLILVPVLSKDTCTLGSTLEDGAPGGLPLQVFLGC